MELVQFLEEKMDIGESKVDTTHKTFSLDEDPLYNNFNFWRDPLPDIDLNF